MFSTNLLDGTEVDSSTLTPAHCRALISDEKFDVVDRFLTEGHPSLTSVERTKLEVLCVAASSRWREAALSVESYLNLVDLNDLSTFDVVYLRKIASNGQRFDLVNLLKDH